MLPREHGESYPDCTERTGAGGKGKGGGLVGAPVYLLQSQLELNFHILNGWLLCFFPLSIKCIIK